jgi:hypothetical protein
LRGVLPDVPQIQNAHLRHADAGEGQTGAGSSFRHQKAPQNDTRSQVQWRSDTGRVERLAMSAAKMSDDLVKALEPFAQAAETGTRLNVGDLRRARATLSKIKAADEGRAAERRR